MELKQMRLMKKMASIIKRDMKRTAIDWDAAAEKNYNNPYDEASPFDNVEYKENIEYEGQIIKEVSDDKKDEVFEGDLNSALEKYMDNFYCGKITKGRDDYGYELLEEHAKVGNGKHSLMVETLPYVSKKENPIICDLNYLYEAYDVYEPGQILKNKLYVTWKEVDGGYKFEAEIK
jgi:hypothetical protein